MTNGLLLLLAATAPKAAEPQLLDVDGTVFVTLGLFSLLFLLLGPLLWKPYLRIRKERVTRVEGYREDAARMAADSKARFEKVEAELAEARRLGAGELAVARAEARTREQTILAEASAEAQRNLVEARTKLDAAMASEKSKLRGRAEELGRLAASKVMGRSIS